MGNQDGKNSQSPKDYNAALREQQVMEKRLKGLEFEEIARQTGYSNASGAWKAWKRVLARLPIVETKQEREESKQRLNVALAAIWDKVQKGDMWAIDRMLALEKRRAELMGLDMVATGGLPEAMRREYVGVNPNDILTRQSDGQTISSNGRSAHPVLHEGA